MGRHLAASFATVIALASGRSIPIASADDGVPLYACKQVPAKTKMTVELRPETSVIDLATWVTGFSCKTIVIDAEVRARVPKVTIVAPTKLTPKQALQLFVDAVEATGLVVLQKKDTIIIKLGPTLPKSCPIDTAVATAGTPTAPTTSPTAPSDDASDDLQKLIDAGIHKIDDTHVEVTKAFIDAVLANPMAAAKGARVVPAVKDGKPDGFKLYAIRPSSFYAKLGFQNGDTLNRINGMELTSADKALEVYTKLREASKLSIDITRRGKPVTLTITIK
jgi:hypothetical protein